MPKFTVTFEAGNRFEGIRTYSLGFDEFRHARKCLWLASQARRMTVRKSPPNRSKTYDLAMRFLYHFAGEPGTGRVISEAKLLTHTNAMKAA